VDLDTKRSLRTRLLYLVGVIAVLYVLISAAIAWNTVDDCGDDDAPKHWSFFPPEWVCERPTPF
jgi:hypothetical protein